MSSPRQRNSSQQTTPTHWYATETETAAGIVNLYRRVQAFMVHTTVDLQRHAGHADILREQFDGSVGLLPGHSNLPDATDWRSDTQRLTEIADRFG